MKVEFFYYPIHGAATPYSSINMVKADHYQGGGFMVWMGIMLKGRTELCLEKENIIVNAQTYYQDIIVPHIRSFRGAIGNCSCL